MFRRSLIALIVAAFSSAAMAYFSSGITSTLTRPNNTTAYAQNTLIASSATPGSIVVPSFAFPSPDNSGAAIARIRLWTSATSGWGGATFTLTLWTAAPTYTNGDTGAYAVATGSAGHVARFTCTLVQYGDGAAGSCIPLTGNFVGQGIAPNSQIYWDLQYTGSASLTPIANQTFIVTPETAR